MVYVKVSVVSILPKTPKVENNTRALKHLSLGLGETDFGQMQFADVLPIVRAGPINSSFLFKEEWLAYPIRTTNTSNFNLKNCCFHILTQTLKKLRFSIRIMNKMGFQILLLFVGLGVCTNYIGLEDVATGTDVFVGIPYAQPPVGALRLQPPLPISNDLGDLNVSSLTSNRCYELNQSLASMSAGSEDCLTLDIVRPSRGSIVNARRDNKLPVYVFIHG